MFGHENNVFRVKWIEIVRRAILFQKIFVKFRLKKTKLRNVNFCKLELTKNLMKEIANTAARVKVSNDENSIFSAIDKPQRWEKWILYKKE